MVVMQRARRLCAALAPALWMCCEATPVEGPGDALVRDDAVYVVDGFVPEDAVAPRDRFIPADASAPRDGFIPADAFMPGPADAGAPDGALSAGLGLDPRFDAFELPYARSGTPHGISLRREGSLGGDLLIADSFGGFYRFATGADAPSTMRYHSDANTPPSTLLFCHRAAVHPASRTVLCGGLMVEGFFRFDGETGRYLGAVPAAGAPVPFDLIVHNEALYFTALSRGLWRRPILAGGQLGPPERLDEGAYVNLVEVPGGIAATERSRGLVLRGDDGSVDAIPLPGPSQNLRLRGTDLLVALGSQGVARVDLTRRAVQHLPVDCVVSAVDATDEVLVVGCRRGVRLYALPPREATSLGPLRDSTRAIYGITDVLAEGDQCYALDWRSLIRYTIRRDLAVVPRADRPLSVAVSQERASRFEVANPFEVPVRAGPLSLAPGARGWLEARPGQAMVPIEGDVRVKDSVLIATLGQEFIGPGRLSGLPFTNTWLYTLVPDCALQWLDLEDMLWVSQRGGFGGGRDTRVLVTPYDPQQRLDGLLALWAPLPFTNLGTLPLAGTTYREATRRIQLTTQLGGPDATLMLELDGESRVLQLSNQYEGRYGLRIEPAP